MEDSTILTTLYSTVIAVALPLIAFLIQAILGKRSLSGAPAILLSVGSLIASIYVGVQIWNQPELQFQKLWFTIGESQFYIGILLNNLTAVMLILIPAIAVPVHIYSTAYMKGDPGIHKYWMYLSLFCFAMMGLVIVDNLLLMYIFWELVGFASYLLIGFWYTRDQAAQANKKAFLINRIGDLGFLIGICIIFSQFGTLDLRVLFSENGLLSQVSQMDSGLMTAAGIAFFIGAMAKSAQFPLHVWLPDAMEGPTSVSSLIHAATMVAAGVFLLCRIFPLFNETVLLIMVIIGTITALSSSFFALGQYDIKKILAFSTISQLGFMMVAVGIGAYDVAMMHLFTHAFFKCLLFLSAGAVIHEMQHVKDQVQGDFDPQDLRNMGGLRRYMPKTALCMGIASLALAGIPLTSGFISKDAIVISSLEWSISYGGFYYLIPITLIIVSIFTAFYIARLMAKAFFGKAKLDVIRQHKAHIQEANVAMIMPMFFLSICCLFPVISWSPISGAYSWLIQGLEQPLPFTGIHLLHLIIPIILVSTAGISFFIAWRWYVQGKYPLNPNSTIILWANKQAYINEFNDKVIVNNILRLAKIAYWFDRNIIEGLVHIFVEITHLLSRIAVCIDRYIVDGLVNGLAKTTYWLGHIFRQVQNGKLQTYLFSVFMIVCIGLLYLILS